MTVSERFFQLLDEKNLRAADLCKILNIGTSVTTGWKNRNTDPPAKYIMQICEFLDVTPEYLLTGTDSIHASVQEEIDLVRMYRELPQISKEFVYDSVKTAYDKELARRETEERLLG